MSMRVTLPKLTIASPCPASWDEMEGDDRRRFCASCQKHVYNFAAMRSDEVAAVLASGPACAQLYQRADGTILTADCPVGVRLARTRVGRGVLRAAAASIALFGAAAGAIGAPSLGERLARSGFATAIAGMLESTPNAMATTGKPGPASDPAIRGEVVVLQPLGMVAPATQPTTQPAIDN